MSGSFLLVFPALLTAIATFVRQAQRTSLVNQWFALHTLASAAWCAGIAGAYNDFRVDPFNRIAFVGASFVPAILLCFVVSYPSRTRRWVLFAARGAISLAFIFAVLSVITDQIAYDARIDHGVLFRKSGGLYPVFAVYVLATVGLAGVLFTLKWQRARGLARAQLQHIGVALLLLCLCGTTTNLIIPLFTGRSTYSWLAAYFAPAFTLLLAHAITRTRLMNLRLVVHRGLALVMAAVMSLLPVGVLLAITWPHLVSQFQPRELFSIFVSIVLVTLLVPLTRHMATSVLDRYVYRQRARYQRTVREASRALTRVLDARQLLPFLQDTLAQATEAEGVVVYVRGHHGFRKALAEHTASAVEFQAPDTMSDDMVAMLARVSDVLLLDDLTRNASTGTVQAVKMDLIRLNWALVLPLIADNEVIGGIALGPKRSGDPYYPDDLDLLMTLANQAAIAVKNAQLYAQVVLANEHLDNIVRTMTSGVVAVDAEARVTMCNRAAEQLTGLSVDTIRGEPASILPAPLTEVLLQTFSDGVACTRPELELSDGVRTRPVMCTASPLHEPSGAVVGAVAVFSDLTPLRELEIERRHAERVAYLEALAAGIAHEVKNPLVAMKTFVQLIPRRRLDERFIDEFSRVVTREIGRMGRLIERLRTLGRPSAVTLGPLDVRQPVVEAMEIMQAAFEEKRLTVDVSLGEHPVLVLGDPAELEQLFLNLLINAHEATPPDGHISIALTRADDHVSVDVADNGPGIPADMLDKLFDPFTTSKRHGRGLGLAICSGIVDGHHARLTAANTDGGGARFGVEFPVTRVVPTETRP